MILSVSRRTDVPRYYMDWFLARLEAGFVLVRNPMNHGQVSRVGLGREAVDCIAFWTKDPGPLLARREALAGYPYFVQFTLNPYGGDIERGLAEKGLLLERFRRLAGEIGPGRTLWRYSPVLRGRGHGEDSHLRDFESFAKTLAGCTYRCRVSFLDVYKKIAPTLRSMDIAPFEGETQQRLAGEFTVIGATYGIKVDGCGNLDLSALGWEKGGCISPQMVAQATGLAAPSGKDPGQPSHCACIPTVDIGSYNSCPHGCVYCYANRSLSSATARYESHNPAAPMLCDELGATDKVTERKSKGKSIKKQLSLLSIEDAQS